MAKEEKIVKRISEKILIHTRNFTTIQKACTFAFEAKKIISLIGYPGAGKSIALEHFCSQIPKRTIYVTVTASMTGRQFYLTLLKALGNRNPNTSAHLHFLINKVVHILNYEKKDSLLIIDEAGKFTAKMLEYLHELRDKTEKTTGIILCGPEEFEKDLRKWASKGIKGIKEVERRIMGWHMLERPNYEEVEAF